jgi:uncharacterized protein YcfJ
MNKITISVICSVLALTACVSTDPLVEYRPVVDYNTTNSKRFEKDLVECRNIALSAETDYRKRQEEQMVANMFTGALVGAVIGASVGDSDYAAMGAVYGAASGASTNDYSYDLVKYGPRRIVDRCMNNRGHQILNDIGRG